MDEHITSSILAELSRARELGKEPAFLFDRISSMRQQDGISLDYQGEGGRAYAERNNLHVVYAFMVVESAYKENRKHLNKILDTAERYGVKNLIFKNVDRLSRNISHANRFKELFEQKGFCFHFYEMGIKIDGNSNYDEKWLLYLHILMAQRHSMKTSHDVKEVYHYKAGKGIPHHMPPDGYIWSAAERMPVIDPSRENVVRMLFAEYDSGASLQAVVETMNARGLVTRTGRPWRKSSVYYILCNPFYAGQFTLKGVRYNGTYSTYFDRDQLTARLERLGVNCGKYNARDFTFSKFLRCAECGALIYGDIKGGKHIYYTHKCNGHQIYVPEAKIMRMIDAEALSIGMSEDFATMLERDIMEQVDLKERDQAGSVAAISREISGIDADQKKLLQLHLRGTLPETVLESQINDLERRKHHLINQRKVLSVDRSKFIITVARIMSAIRRFSTAYSIAPVERRNEFLREIASHITIGSHAEIAFKPPYSFILNKKLRALKELAVTQNTVVLPHLDEYAIYIREAAHRIAAWAA